MLNIKSIVDGLKTKSIKNYNTDLFSADRYIIELGDIKAMTNLVIDESEKNAYTRVARVLSSQDDMAYLTIITQTMYAGDKQIQATVQPLTPQGVAYYWSKSNNTDFDVSIFDLHSEQWLRDEYGISITMEDLRALSVLNTEYDVYMLEFETTSNRYWITLSNEGLLKKVTVRNNNQVTANTSFSGLDSLI